jgi:hypothetical protein
MSLTGLLVVLLLGCSLLLNVVLVFRYAWIRESRARSLLVNLSVLGFTLFFVLWLLDLFFFYFVVRSDSFTLTLAAKRWSARYWATNSLGYRDVEHTDDQFTGRRVLFVVGDSFAAGQGLADPETRFSNILQRELGDAWLVVNIAKNGWSTPEELGAIVSYPHRPDVLILQYYLNDILRAGSRHGRNVPPLYEAPPRLLQPLVKNSHCFNYLYWRVYRFRNVVELRKVAWGHLQDCFGDPDVWQTHERELLDVVDHARGIDAALIAVVFPDLAQVEASRPLTAKVVELLRRSGVATIDMTQRLAGRDRRDLIVNSMDGHPSEAVNREVADLLLGAIRAGGPAASGGPRAADMR